MVKKVKVKVESSKQLKLITLFSGVGMQEMGMKKCGIECKVVRYCEYEKNIAKCFSIIHKEPLTKNWDDITKVDIDVEYEKLKKEGDDDIDIIVSSFPCQSFSMAGKKEGFDCKKNGGLFDKTHEIVDKIRPKIVVLENVKNITSKKFNAVPYITEKMTSSGYKCFHKVLNSVHYGIPQNRERWFMVCVKEGQKDFEFPKRIPLENSVRDFVKVSSIGRKCANRLVPYFKDENKAEYKSVNGLRKVFDGYKQEYIEKDNLVFKTGFTLGRIYSIDGVSPTLTTSNDAHFFELKGRLLPIERWRLMGLSDENFHLLKENKISDCLLDKISGNGIVVNVFEHLFREIKELYF